MIIIIVVVAVVVIIIIVGKSIGLAKVVVELAAEGGWAAMVKGKTLFTQLAAHAQSTQKFSAAAVIVVVVAAVAYVLFS